MLTIICALAANRAIGYQNKLLYHLSADVRRFKALTTGHTIIMGRRTFESLPTGALPNRRNIVLTRAPRPRCASRKIRLVERAARRIPAGLSHAELVEYIAKL